MRNKVEVEKLRKENRSSEVQQRLFLFFTDVDMFLKAFFQRKKRLTFRWKLEKMHRLVRNTILQLGCKALLCRCTCS